MYLQLNSYDDFSTYSMELVLHQLILLCQVIFVRKLLKNGISELCLHDFIVSVLLHQDEDFDNVRTREFEGNKKRRKTKTKRKDGCDRRILHISYKTPLMFFIFSLMVLYKIFIRKDISQGD